MAWPRHVLQRELKLLLDGKESMLHPLVGGVFAEEVIWKPNKRNVCDDWYLDVAATNDILSNVQPAEFILRETSSKGVVFSVALGFLARKWGGYECKY